MKLEAEKAQRDVFLGGKGGGTQLLQEMFDSADTSGNKLLDVDEVKSLLERLGIKLDNQDEARMIKDCDENNDNELSFEEFNQLMKKIQAGEYGHVNIDESKKV